MRNLLFILFFSLILFNLNFLMYFYSEMLILLLSFSVFFYFLLVRINFDSFFFKEEEEINFFNDLDWFILMSFFFKFRNWYRFFYIYCCYKLMSFYKFFKFLKKYFIYWLKSISYHLNKRFYNLNIYYVWNRLLVLERYKKLNKYKNNPLFYLILN
jgi:hypothetical protein